MQFCKTGVVFVFVVLLSAALGGTAWAQQPGAAPRPLADDPGIVQPPRARPAAPPSPTPARTNSPEIPPSHSGAGAPSKAPPSARPAPKKPLKAIASGVVLQLRIGTDFVQTATGGDNMMTSYVYGGGAQLRGSFLLGYRSGRWTLGMGLDLNRIEVDGEGSKAANSIVAFRPSIEYDLVLRYPLTLFIGFGLPVGFLLVESEETDPYYGDGSINDAHPAVGFRVALGARYFPHPRFAIGMEGAFHGLWVILDSDPDGYYDDGGKTTLGAVGFSGSIFMMAIF